MITDQRGSRSVPKGPGDALVSGTWLVSGALVTRVTAVGADSYGAAWSARLAATPSAAQNLSGRFNRVLRWLSC